MLCWTFHVFRKVSGESFQWYLEISHFCYIPRSKFTDLIVNNCFSMTFGRIKKVICSLFHLHVSRWRQSSAEVSGAACGEAACWCCCGACGSEERGRLYRWPWPVGGKKRGASGKRAGDAQRDGSNTASTSSNLGRLCRWTWRRTIRFEE